MTAAAAEPNRSFVMALAADGRDLGIPVDKDLYGWLIGSWDLDVAGFRDDGSVRRRTGEWHFSWVLEGRAIQDVWIVPSRATRSEADPADGDVFYGTTLRSYNSSTGGWRIQWSDPASRTYFSMLARRDGNDIIQDGTMPGGGLIRWSFHDIAADSFTWRSHMSAGADKPWRMNAEFQAKRRR